MEAAMAGIGIATPSPQTPTVGAGSSRFSRRFPRPSYSPYAKIPPPTAPAAQTRPRGDTLVGYGGAAPLIATRHATSLQRPRGHAAIKGLVRTWGAISVVAGLPAEISLPLQAVKRLRVGI